jgi:hypothetical protein
MASNRIDASFVAPMRFANMDVARIRAVLAQTPASFAFMGARSIHVAHAVELPYVSMERAEMNACLAEELLFANTESHAQNAVHAAVCLSASTAS